MKISQQTPLTTEEILKEITKEIDFLKKEKGILTRMDGTFEQGSLRTLERLLNKIIMGK